MPQRPLAWAGSCPAIGLLHRLGACKPVMMDVQTGFPACAYSPVAPAAEHEFGTVGGCWPFSSARENLLSTRRPLWLRSWLSRRRAQTRSLAGGWGVGGTIGESKPGRAAHHLHARPGRHGRTRDVSGDRDGSLACGSVAVAFEGHQRSANCLRLPSAVFGLVGWCGWLTCQGVAGLVRRGEVGDSATELVARRATGLMVTL
jgi:hypothetical protein